MTIKGDIINIPRVFNERKEPFDRRNAIEINRGKLDKKIEKLKKDIKKNPQKYKFYMKQEEKVIRGKKFIEEILYYSKEGSTEKNKIIPIIKLRKKKYTAHDKLVIDVTDVHVDYEIVPASPQPIDLY